MIREIIMNKIVLILTFLAVYFAPLAADLVAMGVLITIDLILGVYGAKRTGVKITSNKLKQTVVKSLVYMLLLIAAFLINTTLVTYLPMVSICLAFLSLVEFTSIAENFQIITGLPFVKYLKDKIGDKVKKDSDK